VQYLNAKHRSVKFFYASEIDIAYTIHSAPSPGQAKPAS